MFRVDPKTVTRWAKAGKLTSIRTLGGHRRYRETEVRALLAGIPQPRSEYFPLMRGTQRRPDPPSCPALLRGIRAGTARAVRQQYQ